MTTHAPLTSRGLFVYMPSFPRQSYAVAFELKCPKCGTVHSWTTARACSLATGAFDLAIWLPLRAAKRHARETTSQAIRVPLMSSADPC